MSVAHGSALFLRADRRQASAGSCEDGAYVAEEKELSVKSPHSARAERCLRESRIAGAGARTLRAIVSLSSAVHGPSGRALAAAPRRALILTVASAQDIPGRWAAASTSRNASSGRAEQVGRRRCHSFAVTGTPFDQGATHDRLAETTNWLPATA